MLADGSIWQHVPAAHPGGAACRLRGVLGWGAKGEAGREAGPEPRRLKLLGAAEARGTIADMPPSCYGCDAYEYS